MDKKSFLGFISLLFIMLISMYSSGVSAAGATSFVVATDPANDVIEYTWTNYVQSVKTDQSKSNIDIVKLYYGVDANNNGTVTLSVSGTANPNNETFYWVSFQNDPLNITGFAWSGAFDNSSSSGDCMTACVFVAFNGGLGYQNASAIVSGGNITWTLPSTVVGFNATTFQPENLSVNWPTTVDANWNWTALTWTGTFAYSSAGSSSIKSGSWWEDSLETSSTEPTSSSKGLPGLDALPVISLLTVASLYVIFVNKRKNKNS